MYRIALLFVFIMNTAVSQDRDELDKRNGFKDLKLGISIDSVQVTKLKKEFKERNEFEAKLYEVENPAYEKIGEVKVKSVEVKTYKDLIYEINVIVDKDTRVMKALESLYGKSDYDMKSEIYFWKTSNLVLKFGAHGKHHLELTYISLPLHQKMKEDKGQKVDDIANDF
ncbi:MAG TPA: hypothetical protein PLS08_11850 [Chryseolinea sp.]|nr:hypothetical protein [Chryseolinea sp.]